MTVPEEIKVRVTPMSRVVCRVLAAVAALVVVVVTAPASFAAPALSISQTQDLQDGQTVTISATGYEPNISPLAIGQCVKGYKGPADCNTAGGAVFKASDGSGKVASFQIKVKKVFGGHDCTKVQCVIAGAPLPTNADAGTISRNTYSADITFASAAAPSTPSTSATPTATETTATGSGSLPQTGAGDSVPVLVLGATALLAAGAGVMLLVPGRRRGEHAR